MPRSDRFPWLAILCVAGTLAAFRLPARGQAPPDRYAPGVMPDRIVLTWTGDPARSMTATWRTSVAVASAVAQIAPAQPGPRFAAKSRTAAAVTRRLDVRPPVHFHTATFDDLLPGTRYSYRVGDGTTWSEWFQFETASDRPEPFTFVYFGDAQNDIRRHWSRVVREAYRTAPKARFFLHAGDLVNIPTFDGEWGAWFEAGGWIHASVPAAPVAGNHEYLGGLSPYFAHQFPLPANGPVGFRKSVYFLDIQGVRFVFLDSNVMKAEQVEWLDDVLAKSTAQWNIVTLHHPVFPPGDRENPVSLRVLLPVLNRRRVDLVLQGHDHSYARSGMMEGPEPGRGRTVYVVSVSGPKPYAIVRQDWMRRWGSGIQLFQTIRVDRDRLQFEARTAAGERFDAFELRRKADGSNQLVEDPQFQYPSGEEQELVADGPEEMLPGAPPVSPPFVQTTWVNIQPPPRVVSLAALAVLVGILFAVRARRKRTLRNQTDANAEM